MRPKDLEVDLSKMIPLEMPLSSRGPGMILRITEKDCLCMNSVFIREIKAKVPSMLFRFLYQADYKVIALQAGQSGEGFVKFNADGNLKHSEFVNQLREAGYQIPARYTVEWSDSQQAWIGMLEEVPELKDVNSVLYGTVTKKNTGSRKKGNVKV